MPGPQGHVANGCLEIAAHRPRSNRVIGSVTRLYRRVAIPNSCLTQIMDLAAGLAVASDQACERHGRTGMKIVTWRRTRLTDRTTCGWPTPVRPGAPGCDYTFALDATMMLETGQMMTISECPDWLVSRPIAHRGLHDINVCAPENSLAAFERAVSRRIPIELDVQLTSDGKLVVVHDADLARLTGLKRDVKSVEWPKLRRLTILDTDQTVPLLDDVLDLIRGATPVVVEIKSIGPVGALERRAIDCLRHYDGPFAVQSFNPLALKAVRATLPDAPRGQISGLFRAVDLDGLQLNWVKRTLLLNLALNPLSRPHFVNYQLEGVPATVVSILRRVGLPILVWTVKSVSDQHLAQKYSDNFLFEGFMPDELS
jgi:glycerophosphoryl diester phosphodiesterase